MYRIKTPIMIPAVSISKLKKIQSSFINFFIVPFSKKCERLTLIGRDFLSPYLPLIRGEMSCLSQIFKVIFGDEKTQGKPLEDIHLWGFFIEVSIASCKVSAKPFAFPCVKSSNSHFLLTKKTQEVL